MELTPIHNSLARPAPHPICLLIPSADEDELQDLTDDVRAHGLIDPIVLFEGMILDGRNRSAACERAGVEPRYAQFRGGREDALILVISRNLKRSPMRWSVPKTSTSITRWQGRRLLLRQPPPTKALRPTL